MKKPRYVPYITFNLIKYNKRLPKTELEELPKVIIKNHHHFVTFAFTPKNDKNPQNTFHLPSQSRIEPFKELRTYVST